MHVYPGVVNSGHRRDIVVIAILIRYVVSKYSFRFYCFRKVLDTSHSMFYQSFDIKLIAQTSHLAFNLNPVIQDRINGMIAV
jgi:hypothetical protein